MWYALLMVSSCCTPFSLRLVSLTGAILSSKAQSDAQLEEVRGEARKTIHILHKLQARFTKEVVRKYIDDNITIIRVCEHCIG